MTKTYERRELTLVAREIGEIEYSLSVGHDRVFRLQVWVYDDDGNIIRHKGYYPTPASLRRFCRTVGTTHVSEAWIFGDIATVMSCEYTRKV